MRDREQKEKALRYAASKRWFPQLEVEVQPPVALDKRVTLLTDLDVFASMPDDFIGFRGVVFDCKTRAKESPVNRALWLRGVLDRMHADQGICILRKNFIEPDHKLVATKLGIILLGEDEFDLYARATAERYLEKLGHVACIGTWERYFSLKQQYPNIAPALDFSRSWYWMLDDAAEGCRKTLAKLHENRAELDPSKGEHLAIAFDLASLFARSLAIICSYIFKAYLHPKRQEALEEALKVMLYGGREAYLHRNQLYRMLRETKGAPEREDDLSLPEWGRFLQLVRQALDCPVDVTRTPLILREIAFVSLMNPDGHAFAKQLCTECPQAGRFALLTVGYLFRAAKLSAEFVERGEETIIKLLER